MGAIRNSNLKLVTELFDKLNVTIDEDTMKEAHWHILTEALLHENLEIINYLADRIDVNYSNYRYKYLLENYIYICNVLHNLNIIIPVLTKTNLNGTCEKGNTLLHISMIKSDDSYKLLSEWLLNNGADPLIVNDHCISPLYLAINNHKIDMVELCLKYLKNSQSNDSNIHIDYLFSAVRNNNYDIVEMVIPFIKDINELIVNYECTILKYASDNNHAPIISPDIIELLIESGAHI